MSVTSSCRTQQDELGPDALLARSLRFAAETNGLLWDPDVRALSLFWPGSDAHVRSAQRAAKADARDHIPLPKALAAADGVTLEAKSARSRQSAAIVLPGR